MLAPLPSVKLACVNAAKSEASIRLKAREAGYAHARKCGRNGVQWTEADAAVAVAEYVRLKALTTLTG